jgi:hypothetical protein
MRALISVALLVVACAPAPAEKLRNPKRKKPPAYEPVAPRVERARPEIDLAAPALPPFDITIVEPDPTHELRWPLALSDHPELEPQFDVAKVLAEPGLDWIELCQIGAHRRVVPKVRDQLLYLRAWCAAGASNYPGAIETLIMLRNTVVPGLAAAVRADIANILVSHDPNSARSLVGKFGLASEGDVLDRVAATYADMNKLYGAMEINELALANDSGVSPAKTCQRLARRVLLAPDTYRSSKTAFSTKAPVPGFADDPTPLLFGAKLNQDARCRELDAQLSCWLIKSNCLAWYKMHAISEQDASLLDANAAWPRGAARADEDAWWRVVNPAFNARPRKEAYAFAALALEASLKLTDCKFDWGMNRVRNMMSIFVSDQDAPPELVERIKALDEKRVNLCFDQY